MYYLNDPFIIYVVLIMANFKTFPTFWKTSFAAVEMVIKIAVSKYFILQSLFKIDPVSFYSKQFDILQHTMTILFS